MGPWQVRLEMEIEAYEELNRLEPTHWWYQGMRQITDQLLVSILKKEQMHQVLDVGCGVGGNLAALSPYGQTWGIDYSPIALNFARKLYQHKLALANAEHLPYATHSFDLITSFDVLYCREVADDILALSEIARVLRPDGLVLIRLPALDWFYGPHDQFVHGARRYSASELQIKLRTVGLEPLHCIYANSILSPLIFIIRQWQRIWISPTQKHKSDVKAVPPIINKTLIAILVFEARCISAGVRFPFGVSVFCLAYKRTNQV